MAMRKGTTRKRFQGELKHRRASLKATNRRSLKPGFRAKRLKKSKLEPELVTEYFEEKRNFEDLWQAAFPVGTEWDHLDVVYSYNWNFSNLENAFDDGGILHGKIVYLFGCTEPQLVPFKGDYIFVYIPAVVAVVTPLPPSDKIAINSVQRESEEIIPMKQMKMDWIPYVPRVDRENKVERQKSNIFILSCTQRRAALKHLKVDRLKKYEYCLPYFFDPFKEDELEQSTVVEILYPDEPKPIFREFDWTMDELESFTENLIEEKELSEDQSDAFKQFVRSKIQEAKKANREAREARKKALEEMSEETKNMYKNMKLYKFYPYQTPDTPEISSCKALFINRYYGKADAIL